MKTSLLPAIAVLAFLVCVGAAASADPTLAERAAAIDRAAEQPDGERVVLGHVSRALGMSVETLRTERAQSGLGWGELLVAHRLSFDTGRSLGELVSESRSGKDWETIAREHHADLEALNRSVRQSQEVVEQHSEDRAPHGVAPSSPSGRSGSGGHGGTGRGRR